MCIPINVSNIVYPCEICLVNINNMIKTLQLNVIFVSLGFMWNVNKLNHIDYYKFLQSSNDPWYCLSCCSNIFPFATQRLQFISSPHQTTNSIKKVYFHWNLLLIWLSYIINSITLLQQKTVTLKMLLTPNSMWCDIWPKKLGWSGQNWNFIKIIGFLQHKNLFYAKFYGAWHEKSFRSQSSDIKKLWNLKKYLELGVWGLKNLIWAT